MSDKSTVDRLRDCGIYGTAGPYVGGICLDGENARRVAAIVEAAQLVSIQMGIHLKAYRGGGDRLALPSVDRLQELKDRLDQR